MLLAPAPAVLTQPYSDDDDEHALDVLIQPHAQHGDGACARRRPGLARADAGQCEGRPQALFWLCEGGGNAPCAQVSSHAGELLGLVTQRPAGGGLGRQLPETHRAMRRLTRLHADRALAHRAAAHRGAAFPARCWRLQPGSPLLPGQRLPGLRAVCEGSSRGRHPRKRSTAPVDSIPAC